VVSVGDFNIAAGVYGNSTYGGFGPYAPGVFGTATESDGVLGGGK
jgi:hypothetical protein